MTARPFTDREEQSIRDRLRNCIGKVGVAAQTGKGGGMLIQVVDIRVEEDSWSAEMCNPDDTTCRWRIGPFPWSDEHPYVITSHYWGFPLLSEKCVFDPAVVALHREEQAERERKATEEER